MADMGIPYATKEAIKGAVEGDPHVLENVHDPGREGTKDAQAHHAHATTSQEDPPTEINTGSHHHKHSHHTHEQESNK